MQLDNINSEGALRQWLTDNIGECEGRVKLNWIEPSIYGSSVGQPDVNLTCEGKKIGLELKYLLMTRKGIKWTVRPAQRRWHHMTMRQGGRSALMAYIAATGAVLLVRGDNIPLRDYASDPASGCLGGKVNSFDIGYFSLDRDRQTIFNLENLLFHGKQQKFWEKKAHDEATAP